MLLAVAAVCLLPNPHPHVVRNADDAIAAVYADSRAGGSQIELAQWEALWTARKQGADWIVTAQRSRVGSILPRPGSEIWVDGRTGCVTWESGIYY
jgi:hypothetical protein